MKIPDVDKFEARLRKAEDDLGIKPGQGVPVTFVHDQLASTSLQWFRTEKFNYQTLWNALVKLL